MVAGVWWWSIYRFMTVREHLSFAAAVKLGRQASAQDKKDRIAQVGTTYHPPPTTRVYRESRPPPFLLLLMPGPWCCWCCR